MKFFSTLLNLAVETNTVGKFALGKVDNINLTLHINICQIISICTTPLLISYILCKLRFTEITESLFNTTCCREKGVPEKCIGNCENAKFRDLKRPPSICDQFKTKIDECIIIQSGNFETYTYIFSIKVILKYI